MLNHLKLTPPSSLFNERPKERKSSILLKCVSFMEQKRGAWFLGGFVIKKTRLAKNETEIEQSNNSLKK